MSKTNETKNTYAVKTIAVALAPYIVIVVAASLFAGVVTGWTLRSNDIGRTNAQAHSMVKDLATELKK